MPACLGILGHALGPYNTISKVVGIDCICHLMLRRSMIPIPAPTNVTPVLPRLGLTRSVASRTHAYR